MTHANSEPIEPIVIESDNPLKPFTESRLRRKIGNKTLKRLHIESYGTRNLKDREKGGWYLAAGAIIVTAAGIEYFRHHHVDKDEE